MLLRGVDVWDGESAIGVSDVEFADGQVVGVASSMTTAHGPAGAAAISSGLTLIPGLIDTHVRLVGDASHSGADFHTPGRW